MARARLDYDQDQNLANLYNDVLAGFADEEEEEQSKALGDFPHDRRNHLYISRPRTPSADAYDHSYQHQVSARPPRAPQPTNTRLTSRPLPRPPTDPISPVLLTGGSAVRPPPPPPPPPATFLSSYHPETPMPTSPTFQSPRPAPVPPPPPPPPPGAALPRSTSQPYSQRTSYPQQQMRRNESAPVVHAHAHTHTPFRPPPGAALPTPPSASNGGVPAYHHSNGSNGSAQDDMSAVYPPSRNVSYSSSGSARTPDSPGAYSPIAVNPMTKSTFDLGGGIDGAAGPKFDHYPPPPSLSSSVTGSNLYRDDILSTSSSLQRESSFSSSIYGGTTTSAPQPQMSPPTKTAVLSPPMITPPAPIPVASPSASSAPPSSAVSAPTHRPTHNAQSSSSSRAQRHAEELQRTIASLKAPLEDFDADLDDDFDDDIDEDPDRFVILALLSHLAVRLRDKVPRGTHVKGSIPYARAFTGKDIVSTIQSQIQRELLINMGISTNDRRVALGVARSLQSQLFFYEVEWGGKQLQDGVEDVYMFLDDSEGMSGDTPEREELPTGVITMLTKCYSPLCQEGMQCYVYGCPRRASSYVMPQEPASDPAKNQYGNWEEKVDPEILKTLPVSERKRQNIIRQVVEQEEQYVRDLDTIESLFIKPLRKRNPPIMPPDELDSFIDTVFGNILDLRECNRRLLETMFVRQREQAPIIQRIGDIFLTAAAEFRLPYPDYVGHLPIAEKRMKDEIDQNNDFRQFVDACARHPDARRFDLRHFITRPSEHLQKYPVLLEAIMKDTTEGNPDAEFLEEAVQAIRKLGGIASIRTFQNAMLRGQTAKMEWYDLVSSEVRESLTRHEVARQGQIFELIKGEMEYVKDLENIEHIFIKPLRAANPPIIPPNRLEQFIEDVFYNFAEIHRHHKRMLSRLHEIQREEHPVVNSITAVIFDAALNWRDAYMDFIPHYPISAYRVDEEMANNPAFKTFVEQCTRNPEARKLDIKAFIYRPIPRLLRYDLLLKGIMAGSPIDHEDKETIPQVLEVIKALGKDSEPGVVSAKQKVELWKYNANLVFKPGESVDMDLLNEGRVLMHTGKLLRQPENGFEWSGWSELFVLLFDNYLVMTKPKEKDRDRSDGVTKYHVTKHPIPLDLLTLVSFSDPPQQRGTGILRGLRGNTGNSNFDPNFMASGAPNGANGENPNDSRTVYPCTIHHNGRLGGLYTLYAESAAARTEWKAKLDEALSLRRAVTDSNKVFEMEVLSSDTFLVPSIQGASSATYNQETVITGKVTCSVPFCTADGLRLVAVGCSEGVWIGLRQDPRSMRRVLHLKLVTQCAMLEDFGIFLVLADKCLWAYHIEALVPTTPQRANMSRAPQKLHHNKDVQFFSVGQQNGRTLVIYMKKKGNESVFHVLEPVLGKIAEKPKAPGAFGRSLFGNTRSDWFRQYRDFFLPSECYDVVFLKAKIAVLCPRGFEIMDINDFKNVTIPQREDGRLASLAKRFENSRPLGMFRSSENEFLLCYDEFGIYVDRYGDPSRPGGLIEWEGRAERVAFHPPHVLLFDSRFIEVRHIDTGRLAQVIHGNDIRCIWDGRGTTSIAQISTPGPNGWEESPSQEARVHVVLRASEGPRGLGPKSGVIAQQVVELVPTVPLYLPGSLSSPANQTYFPASGASSSPPHSPPMRPRRWA